MSNTIESIGIERLLIVILLSACWVFVYIGINTPEEDSEEFYNPSVIDMVGFAYSNIVTVIVTLYVMYQIITGK